MTDWQPIETAPKDGTRIIGADYSRDGRGRLSAIWWQSEFSDWISGARIIVVAPGYTVDGVREKLHSPEFFWPTHWMPLPEPPK